MPDQSSRAQETAAAADSATLAQTAGGEREILEAFLDYLRSVIIYRVAGLSEQDARRRLVSSETTAAGMLVHLAAVERNWFQRHLLQRDRDEIGLPSSHPDESWTVPPQATVSALIADYEAACAQSRAAARDFALQDTVPHTKLDAISLRWILVHMIEETGRHAGHLDILREQLDGMSGGY